MGVLRVVPEAGLFAGVGEWPSAGAFVEDELAGALPEGKRDVLLARLAQREAVRLHFVAPGGTGHDHPEGHPAVPGVPFIKMVEGGARGATAGEPDADDRRGARLGLADALLLGRFAAVHRLDQAIAVDAEFEFHRRGGVLRRSGDQAVAGDLVVEVDHDGRGLDEGAVRQKLKGVPDSSLRDLARLPDAGQSLGSEGCAGGSFRPEDACRDGGEQ